jgi:hypothetical protein
MRVRLCFTEELLGTKPANKEVFGSFIASKAPDDDKRKQELDTAEHREEQGTTIFAKWPRREVAKHDKSFEVGDPDELIPGLYDYTVKGFFKEACTMLKQTDGTISKSMTAHKSKIDGLIFVEPRFIPFHLPEGATLGINERPLRAETAQGPRVSVVRSETAPVGTTIEFTITTLAGTFGKPKKDEDDESARGGQVDAFDVIREWFDYGAFKGFGCWRNASHGRITWEEVKAAA